jgi:hypothetical protein
MGAELFIVLERQASDVETYVNGRHLSQAEPQLDELAVQAGVTPLMNFFSQDPEEALEMMADIGVDADDVKLPEETWFEPTEGLKTVQTLIERLTERPELCENAAEIVGELEEFQAVLTYAQRESIRWHLGVDF